MNNNGKQKITAIERLDHTAFAVGTNFKKRNFDSLKDLKEFADRCGYEINIEHSHGAGLCLEVLEKEETRRGGDAATRVPVLRSVCTGVR
jgi:hypothetical protein